ncbi:hypothetical protein HY484_03095, partial [Candidatus Woesearchaeota archaeon]|nr:hypothetical protein [Candidatus Woesearchaeota archaeon]
MEIIIDACSAILLGKASVLETFIDTYEVYFTEAVINEVLKGKSKMFEDAFLLERLQKDKKIKTVLVSPNIVKKLMFDFNMGVGEASVVASGIGRKNVFIVTDNRQGRKAARINHISVVGSIEIVVSLYKN